MSDEHFTDLIHRLRGFIRTHGGDEVRDSHVRSAAFEDLARELFAVQFGSVAPYQALCRARGVTPSKLGDGCDIPAVPTSAFKEFEFTSLAPAERTRVFCSSGTTGAARSRHFHSPDSLALYADSLCAWFQPHLLPELGRGSARATKVANPQIFPIPSGCRFLVLAPPAADAVQSSLAYMFTEVASRWSAASPVFLAYADAGGQWHLHTERVRDALADAVRTRTPVVLLGTAFMFVHMLDGLENRCSLPAGSRALETGGYKGRSREVSRTDLYAGIADALGIPASCIVSEYGMSELSSQAYDHVVHALSPLRRFGFPPWARAWVVSPEDGREVADGEAGLLRVLDLANVRSIMAVQTEDLVVRRGEGFELVGRLPQAEAKGCSLLAT